MNLKKYTKLLKSEFLLAHFSPHPPLPLNPTYLNSCNVFVKQSLQLP